MSEIVDFLPRHFARHFAVNSIKSSKAFNTKAGIYKWLIFLLHEGMKQMPEISVDENNSSILIVGHNPTLHILIEKLTNKFIHKFATCNLAKITSKNLWKDTSFGSCELKLLTKPNGIKN